jgi:hypothetical protein
VPLREIGVFLDSTDAALRDTPQTPCPSGVTLFVAGVTLFVARVTLFVARVTLFVSRVTPSRLILKGCADFRRHCGFCDTP